MSKRLISFFRSKIREKKFKFCFMLVAYYSNNLYAFNSYHLYDRNSVFKKVHYDWYSNHAEFNLIKKIKHRKMQIKEIYVVRFLSDGSLACSKPCPSCSKFLKNHGIIKCNYINSKGEWDSW